MLTRWWRDERRRTREAGRSLARAVGSPDSTSSRVVAGSERPVLAMLLLVLPALKSAQLLIAALDTPLLEAVRQAVFVVVLAVWFAVATRHDRRAGRLDVRRALGMSSVGRGAARAGSAVGRLTLVAAFLAAFVVAPSWGRVPLVAVSVLGVGLLGWWWRRSGDAEQRWEVHGALLATVVPPVVVYAGVGLALLAGGEASEASASELLRVVVVTAIGEELLFRGLLLALATRVLGVGRAVAVTSVSFGLWHVGDAWLVADGPLAVRLAVVLGLVVATGVGGVVFAWSRVRTGSLAGPILLHTSTNLPGLALGVDVDTERVASLLRAW